MTRRKSRRKWWGRRPFKAARYKNATYIHEFENEVILRKAEGLGDSLGAAHSFTAEELANMYPDLFDKRYLGRTLKRMRKDGLLDSGRPWNRKPVYKIKREEARAA